jgi:hypothetical protein
LFGSFPPQGEESPSGHQEAGEERSYSTGLGAAARTGKTRLPQSVLPSPRPGQLAHSRIREGVSILPEGYGRDAILRPDLKEKKRKQNSTL